MNRNVKKIIYGEEVRKRIKKGIDTLANTVKVTLGPKGQNVAIEKQWGVPFITKDGVTVAREIEVKDSFENMGVQMVKEVASKTSDIAGDGTTTATVLAQSIFNKGLKFVTAGANPYLLKRGIEKAAEIVIEELKNISKEVSDNNQIVQVGTISANNDKEIGEIIAKAMDKVGTDGVISIEDGKSLGFELEVVEGMEIDRGYVSPYFVNTPETKEVIFKDPYILMVEGKLHGGVKSLSSLLSLTKSQDRPLLIIAGEMDSELLSILIYNKLKNGLQVCVVKPPSFGDSRREILQDIGVLTGGQPIFIDMNKKLEEVTLEELGQAKLIKVKQGSTLIIDGLGDKEELKERINIIKKQIENTEVEQEQQTLKQRLAKLVGGVAVIKVGASTELEVKEKKMRIEDALHATKAAVEEGIVPGGGVALLRTIKKLNTIKFDNPDEEFGKQIIIESIKDPAKQILLNAEQSADIIIEKIINSNEISYGFNSSTLSFENLIENGVIDPTKVVRIALQNAVSISSLLLTTKSMIAKDEEEDKNNENFMM